MQNQEIQIIWTEKASANLDFFTEQIRDQSGFDDVAERFYEKVLNRVSRLRTKPEWIGIPVKEYPGAGYKSIFVMDYRIIFRVIGNRVFIVAFLHKRMLIDKRFENNFL